MPAREVLVLFEGLLNAAQTKRMLLLREIRHQRFLPMRRPRLRSRPRQIVNAGGTWAEASGSAALRMSSRIGPALDYRRNTAVGQGHERNSQAQQFADTVQAFHS